MWKNKRKAKGRAQQSLVISRAGRRGARGGLAERRKRPRRGEPWGHQEEEISRKTNWSAVRRQQKNQIS